MSIQTTELQTPIHYQPVYEISDLIEAIMLLEDRVKNLESITVNADVEALRNEINKLADILYKQQLKMQRVEYKVGV